jgi:hypothetical protein
LIIGLAAALVSYAGSSFARAEDPALDMWLQQRSTNENYVKSLKPLDKHRLADVLEIRVENKFLVLHTPLANLASGQLRTNFDGIAGTVIIGVNREDQTNSAAEPPGFSLQITDFPQPKKTTTISVNQDKPRGQFTLSKTLFMPPGFQQIIFNQQRGPATGGTGFVQLMITESRAATVAPEQQNLEAEDFVSFVREHPAETERYVRPMLRELGQEAVFAPDQMVAWQVFSDLWKPDSAATRQVQNLLPSLNADDYHQRDATLGQLQQLGRDGAAVLMHLDRSHLTPEQNARIDRALLPYAQLPLKEAARLRSDPGFLLDCLYSDDSALRKTALTRLRQVVRAEIQFDVDADAEPRAAAILALRSQLLSFNLPSTK